MVDPVDAAAPAVEAMTTVPADNSEAPPISLRDMPDAANDGRLKTSKRISISAPGFTTSVDLTDHGLDVIIDENSSQLTNLLKPGFALDEDHLIPDLPDYLTKPSSEGVPSLNVVIQIVGSRGDVQPFVALGKVLREKYGHRVRIATHLVFKEFVEENGLLFFSIGGDPAELMAFMVHNPGLIPDVATLRSGEVGRRRKGTYEMLVGCWRSCIEAGDGTGPAIFEAGRNEEEQTAPFIADCIIANPPSFAYLHCAEKLGIPCHMMFTMPWSPTKSFPHPLVNIRSSNADGDQSNFISYALFEMVTWQGLGDIINKFRKSRLNLQPISLMWAPGMASRLRVPFTYCWSPALIPKPKDWGPHISVSGFYFLSLASAYTPDPALLEFLAAGPPPVYIGFGSIVVDDPDAMTKMIFDAVKKAGIRALVSKGWGGLGASELGQPKEIFMLGNVPHDWLFQHVSAVVHHGGAGTTAAGITAGKPTVVVPFFGDQPFWGAMIARAGAGPSPIPYKSLNVESLVSQLKIALKPETLIKAKELGESIATESGCEAGATQFHSQLGDNIRCSVLPDRAAMWSVKKTDVKFSGLVATVLINQGLVDLHDLKLHRTREYELEDGPWDPVSGVTSTLIGTLGSLAMGVADLPTEFYQALKAQSNKSSSRFGTSNTSLAMNQSLNNSNSSLSGSKSVKSLVTNSNNSSTSLASDAASTTPTASVSEFSKINKSTSALSTTSTVLSTNSSHPSSILDPKSPDFPIKREEFLKHRPSHAATVATHAAEVVIKAPMDLAFSVAQGFHNVPKLYGDTTVRQPESITGFQSGVKAASKDLILGFYDGISGLVTQPVNGTRENGVAGLLSGVAKGVGGLVLKPVGAVAGLPSSILRGVYKELEKSTDFCLQTHIMLSRLAQGVKEAEDVTPGYEAEIIKKWREVMREADERAKDVTCIVTGQRYTCHHGLKFKSTRHMTLQEAQAHTSEAGLKHGPTASVQEITTESDRESLVSADSDELVDPKMEVRLPGGKIKKKNMSLRDLVERVKHGHHKDKHLSSLPLGNLQLGTANVISVT
ncbi:hypothetical protein BP6252_09652 [Coleophoma cylindrospora]|uniref:Uncharacterized protein n=1 Tax=Coleophoma cylindrospora TaxID=1849047 RepID=A0A3D8QW72_9HELO|nr:hypothetical protein BP6252_09652 [Coleophoma cylindrospora]